MSSLKIPKLLAFILYASSLAFGYRNFDTKGKNGIFLDYHLVTIKIKS